VIVGVVVPARDEEQRIDRCLDALAVAAARVEVPVHVTVVLDACSDGTAARCARRAVRTVEADGRGIGRARNRGVGCLVADRLEAGDELHDLWLATTDADSTVDPDWLTEQLSLAAGGADAVLGVVDVDDPSPAFRDLYGDHTGTHPHIHGASMGFSLRAYLRIGGFRPAEVGEDVDLVARLDADPHLRVVRSTRVRVRTSDRRSSRVRGGFADVLRALDAGEQPPQAVRA
jgi:glycosyltransferase involved in cell wall biosynthesis